MRSAVQQIIGTFARVAHHTWVIAIVPVAAVPIAEAQTPIAIGSQFVVNSYTTGYGFDPAIAMNGSGDFVVVWFSDKTDNGDTSGYSVQGRRFAAGASPVGSQFLVNAMTTGFQFRHDVAMDGAGGFIVVWQDDGGHTGDNSGFSTDAQRFDAAGSPVGDQFLVNSYTTSHQGLPAVAAAGSGDFVVVWPSLESDNGDTSGDSIQGQRFDADVGAVGSQFLVNSYTTGSQYSPVIDMHGSGDFVVVWTSIGSYGDQDLSVQGQRFAADGGAVGSQFQVNSYSTHLQLRPAIAVATSGEFVIVWSSHGSDNGDTSGFSIQGQAFDSDGVAVGAQFLVNSYTTSDQTAPAVAVDGSGDFVVVWHSTGSDNGDTSSDSIQGQRFAADGSAVGSQFLVNSHTPGRQRYPAIGMDGSGDFVVVWESGALGVYGRYSIAGRRFSLRTPIFSDGFESGDVSAWSASVP